MATLEPGTRFGNYQIDRPLGRGGMGVVFLAHDTTLHRPVALKVLGSPAVGETAHVQLLREARNAAALNHPNICTVYEVGEANGCAFIAMEYVEGDALSDRLADTALPLKDAVRYGIEAADALAYAHDHGVIHRDLKAANAMVTATGRLKLVDFGLARRYDALLADATTIASVAPAGVAVGTPYAMAPEQMRGDVMDARTDIWALGVLLYEMVSAAKPFSAPTIPELFSLILRDEPAPLPDATPIALRSVIERCLEKDSGSRYQRAGEVGAALEAIRAGTAPRWADWRARVRRRPWVAPAAGLAVAALLVGVNVGSLRELSGRSPTADLIKLAVLPFQNLTGDPEQEYFSDGLTQEMITQLGRLHPQRLSVIARTSSMRYKNRDTSIDEVGRELGVDYVLEGSARREGGRVRISATLIEVGDQTQRWTESFDRELSSILALQSDVALGVAKSLALTLFPAEQTRLASAPAINPEAYDAYLKGRFHLLKFDPETLDTAMQYFQLALKREPGYALAYTGIASVWSARQNLLIAPFSEAHVNAKSAALKALELDDRLAEGHHILGEVLFRQEWNWPAAEKEYRRAIELNPNDADTRMMYSVLLMTQGLPQEAKPHIDKFIELDPLNVVYQLVYAGVLQQMRRYEEAIAQARKAFALPGAHGPILDWQLHDILLRAFHQKQTYQEALAEAKAIFAGDPEILEALSRGFAEGGYAEANRRAAERLAARGPSGFPEHEDVAILYAFAGQKQRALDWLEKGYEIHHPMMPFIGVDPHWDHLRAEPRFQELLRKLNLPQAHTSMRSQ